MATTFFEIQADDLNGVWTDPANSLNSQKVVYALFRQSDHFNDDLASHGVANQAEAGRAPRQMRLNLPPGLVQTLSSRDAFCISPACPTTPSITSAVTKQFLAAKSAESNPGCA